MGDTPKTQAETFNCTTPGCSKTLSSKGGINNHIKKCQPQDIAYVAPVPAPVGQESVQVDQAELEEGNEIMEEWKEIYDVLDKIGEVYDTSEKRDEAAELQGKLERIKIVVKGKADIINKVTIEKKRLEGTVVLLTNEKNKLKEEVDALEAGGSNCHECTLKDQVIDNKEDLLKKKEKEIMVEDKKKKDFKKQLDNQRKIVQDMKHNYEKAIEENNDLKTKLEEKDDDIKHLQEQCGIEEIDDNDEVHVVTERNLMNKTTSGHLCVTCNQRFASNNGLEKHIEEKHTELWCDICGKLFRNRREVNNHMDQCEQLGMEAVECEKCKKKLVRWGSKRHKCQPHRKPISCKVCERVFKTIDEVKKHIADEHRNQ